MRLTAGLCLLLAAVPAFAQFTPIGTPNTSYTSTTTVIPVVGANFAVISSLSAGSQTVSFSPSVDVRTVPGGGWATWAAPPNTESATPRVVAAIGATSLTLTLSQPSYIFGFEVEPNGPGTFTVTATFMNGATVLGTVSQSILAASGARLAAASASQPFTSVVVTAPSGAGGFALAQIRYSTQALVTTVPALNTAGVAGLGMLLAAAGAMLARKQQPVF